MTIPCHAQPAWSTACLSSEVPPKRTGPDDQSSSDWVRAPDGWSRAQVHKTRGLNRQCNRRLKYLFKQAALTVLMKPDHPFRQHYDRLLEGGTKPNNARLTVARKIAALTLAMWKQNKEYDHARLVNNN